MGTFFIFYEDGEAILVYFGDIFIGLVFDIKLCQNSVLRLRAQFPQCVIVCIIFWNHLSFDFYIVRRVGEPMFLSRLFV